MALTLTLFPPESSWRPPRLAELPQDWRATPRLSIDTETCDPLLRKLGPGVRRGGYVAGVSFCFEDGRPVYLPLRHGGGDNVEDPERALEYLRHQAQHFEGEVVGANLGYDLDFLAEAGVEFPAATFRDVLIAEPLLDELQLTYSLDACLGRHGLPLKDEALLREAAAAFKVDPKTQLHELPARYVGQYAEGDAERPLQLLKAQEVQIRAQQLGRVWQLESDLLPVVVRMRRRGVRIDFDQLDRVERFAVAEETKAWAEVHRHTGVAIRVGDAMKAEVVARALEAVDIPLPLTPITNKHSITKYWLAELDHPVAKHIRRARQMSQLRSTFVNSIREHATNGRVHCTFNQVRATSEDGDEKGAAFGRMSSDSPNLQQQPARDPEIGPMWRAVYVPEPGGQWGQLDWSQQEPRLGLHLAIKSGPERIGERAYRSALEVQRRYRANPRTDSHTMFTRMARGDSVVQLPDFKVIRDRHKQVYLAITYGAGGAKVCHELGLPTQWVTIRGVEREVAGPEGKALLDNVDERVPYVRKTAQAVEAAAKRRGFITTIGGRRCRFPQAPDGGYDWTHKAFNRAVQGGSADQAKKSMVVLDAEGAYLQLQVHDELDGNLASEAEGRRYARMMEEVYPLEIPSRIDLAMGPSWGAVRELD